MTGGSRSSLLRAAPRAGLVPVAAFAVHQLRFLLAFGSGAGAELAETGHSYLHSVVPWIMLVVGLSVGAFLFALSRAASGRRSTSSPQRLSFLSLWLMCAACLLAIYCTQEFLEGLFATGHPTGIEGIFGFGGLWAIPSAVAVGLVLAAILRGARWTLDEICRRHSPGPLRPQPVPAVAAPRRLMLVASSPLVRGWCDRGPPAARMTRA